jgi:hypothetical protein
MGLQLMSTLLWAGGMGLSRLAQPPEQALLAELHRENASSNLRQVAVWVLNSEDHQGLPFVIVDKIAARVFVFNRQGQLQGVAAALLGLTRGDEGVPGIGDRPLSLIRPSERTTPSGRFMASLAQNIEGQTILWVDYEQGISLHPVRSVDLSERRLERLKSLSADDNRISYGCINVPYPFWRDVVEPQFQNTMGVVYVLPDTKPLNRVFKRVSARRSVQ